MQRGLPPTSPEATPSGAARTPTSVLDEIDELLQLERHSGTSAGKGVAAARRRAERLAAALDGPAEAADDALRLTGFVYASEAVAATWLDRHWSGDGIDGLVRRLARGLGTAEEVARATVFSRAIREGHVLELPPQLGAETILDMLCAFSGASGASLWARSGDGRPGEVLRAGAEEPTRRSRAAAVEAIDGGRAVTNERRLLHAVPVLRWGHPTAAIVFRCRSEERPRTVAFAAEAASALAPVLEFEALLARNASREESLTAAGERQLTRLGFDLHDGPMQDIAALASDLRLFRGQLGSLLEGHERAEIALGRVDDIEARLIGLDRDLRELARSLHSPGGLRLSLVDALRHEVDELQARTGIRAELSTAGQFEGLTPSQKIALVRLTQAALANAQEHSEARGVSVRLEATQARLSVEIEDDGRGFDVDEALLRAARAGRLGLVGMGERIRLLGGRFEVDSRPGGPTRVRATIPRWTPLTPEGRPDPPP